MLVLLANLPSHPESVPINMWNEVEGVPVNDTAERPEPFALVRLVATARIMMPKSVVRLSAGRQYMTDELQALCFFAGANSIFIGDTLLTLQFTRSGDGCFAAVREMQGDPLAIRIEVGAQTHEA